MQGITGKIRKFIRNTYIRSKKKTIAYLSSEGVLHFVLGRDVGGFLPPKSKRNFNLIRMIEVYKWVLEFALQEVCERYYNNFRSF